MFNSYLFMSMYSLPQDSVLQVQSQFYASFFIINATYVYKILSYRLLS
jgi:hypothetical protein